MPVSRLLQLSILLLVVTWLIPSPALAQNSARVRGVVTDHEGNPRAGATVEIEFMGGLDQSYEITTNEDGEYIQIGMPSGPYNVLVTDTELGQQLRNMELRQGQTFELDIEFGEPGTIDYDALSEEDLARLEAAEATSTEFTAGIEAANSGDLDEAVRAFNEAIANTPDCSECYRNLGIVESRRENYDAAETALRRATEIDPEDAAAFDALADVYNAQRRFDDAADAAAAASRLSGGGGAGGDDPGAVFDQGLIAWNAGRIDDARGLFERTLELQPDHGEANYWLGMASLNAGQIPEAVTYMRTYLEREPDGRFNAEATGLLGQLDP